jgi:hypothetical protein
MLTKQILLNSKLLMVFFTDVILMVDNRGSKHQHHLYDLCCQIYGFSNVVWEYVIPDLNLRIDILIEHLGIAVEYDGRTTFFI